MDKLTKTKNILLISMSIMVICAISLTGISKMQTYYKWKKQRNESQDNRYRSNLISLEKVKVNSEKGLEQNIAYHEFFVIDSVKKQYLIPVSQKSINEEMVGYGAGGGGDPRNRSRNMFSAYYFDRIYPYRGIFNNLILYNSMNSTSICLFNQRIAIIDFVPIINNNYKKKLFILVSTDDTNNDSILNKDDLLLPLMYDFEEKKMDTLAEKNQLILDYKYIKETNEIFLSVAIDKNNNNMFDFKYESNILEKYDEELNKFIPVLNDSLSAFMKNMLNSKTKK